MPGRLVHREESPALVREKEDDAMSLVVFGHFPGNKEPTPFRMAKFPHNGVFVNLHELRRIVHLSHEPVPWLALTAWIRADQR